MYVCTCILEVDFCMSCVDGVSVVCVNLSRFAPAALGDPSFIHIVDLVVMLTCKGKYLKNPYLIAKLIEVRRKPLTYFVPVESLCVCLYICTYVCACMYVHMCVPVCVPM